MAYRRRTRRAPVRRYRRRAPARRVRRAPVRRARYARRRVGARAPYAGALRRTPGRAPRRYGRGRVMHNKQMTAMTRHNGDIVISHTEFIGDLIPSTNGTFKSQVYAFNPGLPNFLPFVQGIANQYQEWQPVHAEVILKSTSGNALNSVNAALGTMGITPVYNVYFPTANVNSKIVAEQFPGATSGAPAKSQMLKLETKNSHNPLDTYFVRSGALATNQTQYMTDLCNLVIWSSGLQTTTASPIAEIWIRYKFVLKSTIPGSQYGLGDIAAHYYNITGSQISASQYFGAPGTAAIVQAAGSSLNLTLGASTITFPTTVPTGNYHLTYQVVGDSTTTAAITVTGTTGVSNLALFHSSSGATTSIRQPVGAAQTYILLDYFFTITDTSVAPVITFSSGTLPANAVSMDLFVVALPVTLA